MAGIAQQPRYGYAIKTTPMELRPTVPRGSEAPVDPGGTSPRVEICAIVNEFVSLAASGGDLQIREAMNAHGAAVSYLSVDSNAEHAIRNITGLTCRFVYPLLVRLRNAHYKVAGTEYKLPKASSITSVQKSAKHLSALFRAVNDISATLAQPVDRRPPPPSAPPLQVVCASQGTPSIPLDLAPVTQPDAPVPPLDSTSTPPTPPPIAEPATGSQPSAPRTNGFPRNASDCAHPEFLPDPVAALTTGKLSPSFYRRKPWSVSWTDKLKTLSDAPAADKPAALRAVLLHAGSLYSPKPSPPGSRDSNKLRTAFKLAKEGYISAAMSRLTREETPARPAEDVNADLGRLMEPPAADQLGHLELRDVPSAPLSELKVSKTQLKRVLGRLPSTSAAGPSGTSFLHLRIAFKAVGKAFISALLPLIQDVVDGVPYTRALSHCILIPIDKKGGGIRPIAIGEALRRVAGKIVAFHATARVLQDKSLAGQFGIGESCGIERLGRQISRAYHQGSTICALDLSNAYGTVSRDYLARVVDAYCPVLTPYLKRQYSSSLLLATTGAVFRSEEGIQQGDPTSPLVFSIAMKPILDRLRAEFPSMTFVAYQDDVYAIVPERTDQTSGATVNRMFARAGSLAEQVGMRLNISKCAVSHRTFADSDSNLGRGNAPRVRNIKVLGVPLGTPHFTALTVKRLAQSMGKECDLIGEMVSHVGPNGAGPGLALLSHSVLTKANSTLRNVAPNDANRSCIDHWQSLETDSVTPLLAKIMGLPPGSPFSRNILDRAVLPTNLGGLGFQLPTSLWAPAYLGAAVQRCRLDGEDNGNLSDIQDVLTVLEANNARPSLWEPSARALVSATNVRHPQSDLAERMLKSNLARLDNVVVDGVATTHIRRRINVTPLSGCVGLLRSHAFQAVLRMHLGLDPFIPELPVCPLCLVASLTDEAGNIRSDSSGQTLEQADWRHAVTCKRLMGGAKTTARHDPIVAAVNSALKAASVPCVSERWLRSNDPLAVDPAARVKEARADLFTFATNNATPVAVDVVVSNNFYQSRAAKLARYKPWKVETVPAVVSLTGHCGRVTIEKNRDGIHMVVPKDNWAKRLAKLVDSPELSSPITQAVFAATWEGNVRVFLDYTAQARAAVVKLNNAGVGFSY